MLSHTPQLCKALLLFLIIVSTTNLFSRQGNSPWTVDPWYETPKSRSTKLVLKDAEGVPHTLYEESNAVLIIEGNYREPGWDNVANPGTKNADLLVKRLESRGFHVLIWKDLTGSQLISILSEVNPNVGYVHNSRLFLYFYGHGYTLNLSPDPDDTRTFLVPVDAPDPVKRQAEFLRVALPITQILELSKQIFAKHTFFALEACKSGAIMSALSNSFGFPRPLGYLLSPEILLNDHKILTAASKNEDILANSPFTPLLAAALEEGDSNHDGYVTASEVVSFVKQNLPRAVAGQTPQVMSFPLNDSGDFIFGAATEGSGPVVASSKTLIVNAAQPVPEKTDKHLDNISETNNFVKMGGLSGTVEGTITGSDRHVLAGANVTILSQTTGWSKDQRVDEQGHYIFSGVPPGTYSIIVKAQGYKDRVKSVEVPRELSSIAERKLVPVETKGLGWAVTYEGTILHTKDGGASWTNGKQTSEPLRSVAFATPQLGWAVGGKGTIIHTEDGGSTWRPQVNELSGTNQTLVSVCFVSPRSGWAVSNSGVILRTEDGGSSWKPYDSSGLATPGVSAGLDFVTFPSPQSGWIISDYGLLHTDDGGTRWTNKTLGKGFLYPNAIFFLTPQTGWAAATDAKDVSVILHTEDGGLTWKRQWRDPAGKNASSFNSIAFTSAQEGWIVGDGGFMLHTVDGGASWTKVTPAPFRLRSVTFATQEIGWAVGDEGVVLSTNNGGRDWKQQIIEPGLNLMSTTSLQNELK
jgi:photosystem II stability/assembly factor-like uncharacterized protein